MQAAPAVSESLSSAMPTVSSAQNSPRRIIVGAGAMTTQSTIGVGKSPMDAEVLVVVSKMKQYIRDLSDMNTSEDVNQLLSNLVREACRKAIENAKSDGRKTVMARDFK